MSISLPDDKSRLRCAHCGNLTRFDVVRSMRTSEFWHTDMAGNVSVEETAILGETVESITCRWCGSADRVEIVPRPEFGGPDSEAAGDGGV